MAGFGPFRQHLVNSSWEAVKELSQLGLGSDAEVELRTLQLPVDYREVKRRVTRIWEDLQPRVNDGWGATAGEPVGGCGGVADDEMEPQSLGTPGPRF
uniref:Uncharacterized protein n=1 Tax=Myotis myotis TaxID=51298 RepID=A0A7J7RSG2_MYOMY|nr:hypothetical protein mMyoMyo1_010225 [Myotis myotis]